MALAIWTQLTGYTFPTVQERAVVDLALPVSFTSGVNFKVITGILPPGLRLEGSRIVGSAFEVPRPTTFKFVVRASNGTEIADRTFNIPVQGEDQPIWLTNDGSLPIGNNQAYFILDSSFVDFQLSAVDSDTTAGQQLKYFIGKGGGELPPGLILTESGRITGFIQPALAITENDGEGTYDTGAYDAVAFDFVYRPSNGYDSYIYDTVFFDFSIPTRAPRKINRNYEFIVTLTDGDTSIQRKFRIFVVGDDFFRADNVVTQAGEGVYTADITYLRSPIWITPNNLGTRRANNYQTLLLETYSDFSDYGPIVYSLEPNNPDVYAVSFTSSSLENRIGTNKIRITSVTGTPAIGHRIKLSDYVTGAGETVYIINNVTEAGGEFLLTLTSNLLATIPNDTKMFFGPVSVLPRGMSFDVASSEVFGLVPYQPAVTETFRFTVKATRYGVGSEIAYSTRTFTINILGEVDSVISWNTPSDLGTIDANFISTLKVSATSTIPNAIMLYKITGGGLPPGLTLNLDGEITGKVNQFSTESALGLTTFDTNTFTLDGLTTSIDREYAFSIQARDQYNYSAITQEFNISINTPNDRLYSNLFVKPMMKLSQRSIWSDFIKDSTIFTPSLIYRPSDTLFGVQKDLSMLVYAGIETTSAAAYISATGLNHKKKQFKFGSVKSAVAKLPGTNDIVYEVVYVEIVDPLEKGTAYLDNYIGKQSDPYTINVDNSNRIYSRTPSIIDDILPFDVRPERRVTLDQTDLLASDSNPTRIYPSSVAIWQERIKNWTDNQGNGLETERNYMPLWMRSIQSGSKTELGYVKAVPLCYCKSGGAVDILLNIKNSNFDFKLLDYTIDRYIIDSVTGYGSDKYIVFKNDRITIS